jgi:geranylgeranyl pyrophosphate synthase
MVFIVMVKEFFDSIPRDILDRSKHLDLVIRSSLCHQAIDDVLSKTVLNGGKRLRPLLTFLTGNLFRVELDKLTPYARATELVHAASLSHDDVIDNATLRRNAPSINILASNKKAVLAGDYLLSKVIVDLCAAGNLELVSLMSKVIKDLSEGEWLQLDLMVNRNYTREAILEVAKMKTSSVMSYCTAAPAMIAGESKEVVNAAYDFGVHLGVAFQLIDDTLDFSSSSDKDALLDLENNIVNSVFYEYLELRPGLVDRFKNVEDLKNLINLNEIQSAVDIVVKRAHEHLELALNNLSIIEKSLKQKYPEKEIDEALEYLRLIVAFLVLRKN